ncbi:MAG: glycosyltransferase family 2 protein [Moraxella sp.]|nr:glycosyltransferase family 2 protein [Moraxella sp.]
MSLISIITPVYNETKNIKNYLDCIEKQTFKNFEIVFVDDGSTDDSLLLLHEEKKRRSHLNIHILSQKNQGAYSARKKAVEYSKAKFVALLDCDDELSENALELAIGQFINDDIDTVLFTLQVEYLDENKNLRLSNPKVFTENSEFSGKEALLHSIDKWEVHGLGVFKTEIFKKSINTLEKYFPNENYFAKDEVITRLNFYFSKNIRIARGGEYFYKCNLQSTTKSLNKNAHTIILNDVLMHKMFLDMGIDIGSNFIITRCQEQARYFSKNEELFSYIKNVKLSIATALKYIWESKNFFKLSTKSKRRYLRLLIWVLWRK